MTKAYQECQAFQAQRASQDIVANQVRLAATVNQVFPARKDSMEHQAFQAVEERKVKPDFQVPDSQELPDPSVQLVNVAIQVYRAHRVKLDHQA